MFFRRPNFSLFQEQSKCNLRKEEKEFLDKAHLDVDDSDDDDGAESSAGTGAEPAIAIDDEQIDFDHHYDIEIDWSSDRDCFTEGQSVYYYHAPNLGGVAGVAALQTRWEPGVIKRRIPSAETDGFHLYEVTSADGRSAGSFSKRQLKARADYMDMQTVQPSTSVSSDESYTAQAREIVASASYGQENDQQLAETCCESGPIYRQEDVPWHETPVPRGWYNRPKLQAGHWHPDQH